MRTKQYSTKEVLERTNLFVDSEEIMEGLATVHDDYFIKEAIVHINGLWNHTKTLHEIITRVMCIDVPIEEPCDLED